MVFTESSLRACRKSLIQQVEKECNDILVELGSNHSLGKRAFASRAATAASIQFKVARYAQLLGGFEKDVMDQIENVNVAISAAMAMDDADVLDDIVL